MRTGIRTPSTNRVRYRLQQQDSACADKRLVDRDRSSVGGLGTGTPASGGTDRPIHVVYQRAVPHAVRRCESDFRQRNPRNPPARFRFKNVEPKCCLRKNGRPNQQGRSGQLGHELRGTRQPGPAGFSHGHRWAPGRESTWVLQPRTTAPFTNVKVDSYSDWGVIVSYATQSGAMRITMANGSPFVWFERAQGTAPLTVWAGDLDDAWQPSGLVQPERTPHHLSMCLEGAALG